MSSKRIRMAVFCLLPLLAIACASRPAAATGTEKLHGTWANKEYFGTYWTHTFTMYPDGRETWFQKSDVDSPTGESRYVIDKKWNGADGSAWYQLTIMWSFASYKEEVAKSNKIYSLIRIDPSGRTLEVEDSSMTWPSEFGALGGTHFTYYRQ